MDSVCVYGLTKKYKDKHLKSRVYRKINKRTDNEFILSNISFVVPEGSILGIVGTNGAGKSTLFKLLINTLHKDLGEIKVLGVDNASKEFNKIKENIGIIYDSLNIPGYLSPKKLDVVLSGIYETWDSTKYNNLLMQLGVSNKPYRTLSRGNKMKLGFAIAFAHDTKLLLLDEATSGIDPMLRNKILEILIDFKNKGGTVIISSHVFIELEKICDDVIFLNKGKVILKDKLKNVLDGRYGETKLEELFINLVQEDVV